MLEALNDLPNGVIGFEAVGEIHSKDYEEVLRPAVDAAASAGEIRLVYVLGSRFDGYSAGAGWQDARLGAAHHQAWKRVALVSDVDWISHLASVFGWMIPGDFELFGLSELPQAIAWAAGSDSV
jgi:hypothetical protein